MRRVCSRINPAAERRQPHPNGPPRRLPLQTGTANNCETTDEDEIFCYCTEHDLVTLGWIHTHPSQTCFLSSVDLHTHCSWQVTAVTAVTAVTVNLHTHCS